MAEIVYLFGAGINRDFKDSEGLQPPLALDFFQQALRHPQLGKEFHIKALEPLFSYIQHYWKLSVEQLRNELFDLESCYTLIQLQKVDAEKSSNKDIFVYLLNVESQLTNLLTEYLSKFDTVLFQPEPFRFLGQIIYNEKPAVLTFNYDTLLESVIESASGVNPNRPATFVDTAFGRIELSEEEIAFSHCNWNLPLSYGVKFDEVQLQRAGNPIIVSKEQFYSNPKNNLYDAPFLKLHGSLNWFTYTGIQNSGFGLIQNRTERTGKIVMRRAHWFFGRLQEIDGEIIEPKIITPVLHKNFSEHTIFGEVWERAHQELSNCKRLIVGGYSFPPTDFHTKRLFLEAFSEHTPEEVIVINPNTSVADIVKGLCHFKKPIITCRDLNEFVSLYQ